MGVLMKVGSLINEAPPFNTDYDKDPHIKAPKRRRFFHHGSTLLWKLAA